LPVAVLVCTAFIITPTAAAEELNLLAWCDHSDPNLLKPFEEANNAKVNVKEYEGSSTGLSLVEQSQPGDWDLMVIDSVDVRRGVEKKALRAFAGRRSTVGRHLSRSANGQIHRHWPPINARGDQGTNSISRCNAFLVDMPSSIDDGQSHDNYV
jgi:hypothetical protein